MAKPKYNDVVAELKAANEKIAGLEAQVEALTATGGVDIEEFRAEIARLTEERDTALEAANPKVLGEYRVNTPQGRVKCADVIVDAGFELTEDHKKNSAFMKHFNESLASGLIKEV